jgi:hypothetical protein
MAKEIRVPHQALRNSQTCSREIEQAFERAGLNVHRHEIVTMEDDHDRGERVIRIQTPRVTVGFGKRG